MTRDVASWYWWLRTTWQSHRHAAEEVHPLFMELQDARGPSFLISEHVLAVLDDKDPVALVRSWIGTRVGEEAGVLWSASVQMVGMPAGGVCVECKILRSPCGGEQEAGGSRLVPADPELPGPGFGKSGF